MSIDKVDDFVDEYDDTYHAKFRMKPISVKSDSYAEYNEEFNKKDPRFKIDDHGRILKYQNIIIKGYSPNWREEIFVIKKVKNTVPWTCVINDLNGDEIIGTFYEKEFQKTNQKEFGIEKIIKRKGNNFMLNGKDLIIHLIVGLIKKTLYKNQSVFSTI